MDLELVQDTNRGLTKMWSVTLLAIAERKSYSIPSNILWASRVVLYTQISTIIFHTHTEGLGLCLKINQLWHFSYPPYRPHHPVINISPNVYQPEPFPMFL